MGKKSIETLVGIFVLLGMAGLRLPGAEGGQPRQLQRRRHLHADRLLRQHRRAQGARAGAQRRRHGRPRRLDQARPEALPGRRASWRSSATCSSRPIRRCESSPRACSATSTSASSPAPRRRSGPPGDTIKQTQSAVVLESLISQFLFSKAADAGGRAAAGAGRQRRQEMKSIAPARRLRGASRCWPSCWRALGGCATIREGARRSGPAPRSLGELEPQGLQLQRRPRQRRAQAGRDRLCRRRAAAGAARRQQLLQQLRRRLVGDQQHAAGQVRARLRGRDAGRHEHAVRPVRHPRRRVRDGPRPSLRGLRPDARPLRRRRRRLRRAADPRARRPCATRPALPLDRLATPPALIDGTGRRSASSLLQLVNTRAEPARRDAA